MDHAGYLTDLYEKISDIPADIQNCLLIIAQHGCDSEQVKRWYSMVRHHFGATDLGFLTSTQQTNLMPPPQTPGRASNRTSQIRPTPPNSNYTSPQGHQTSSFSREPEFGSGVGGKFHEAPIQGLPLLPWPAPETGSMDDLSQMDWSGASGPPLPDDCNLSQELGHGMMSFTGAGLLPELENNVVGKESPSKGVMPMPYQFTMNSGIMPIFVRFKNSASMNTKEDLGQSQSVPLSGAVLPQQSPSSAEHLKKRNILPNKPKTSAGPLDRPRRPTIPFRQGDRISKQVRLAPKSDIPSPQASPRPSTFDTFPYSHPPMFQSEPYANTRPSPKLLPRPHHSGHGLGIFDTEQHQSRVYKSPYA